MLCQVEFNLISEMEKLGAKAEGEFFIIGNKAVLNKFIRKYPNEYQEASKLVKPTKKQIELIEEIINQGVSFHFSVYDSMYEAYEFIGANNHHLRSFYKYKNTDPTTWGNIPNT